MAPAMADRIWTAALCVIGDEILSGRTQDRNIAQIGLWLNLQGIRLKEVRVVPDDMTAIGAAVTVLAANHDYLFTTGGIGPTHDDITVDAIASALGLPVVVHPQARAILEDYYADRGGLSEARLRMARTPEGASLIVNENSGAPGIRIGNIFVLAGVPHIAAAMLDSLSGQLEGGRPLVSATIGCWVQESDVADLLTALTLEDQVLRPIQEGVDAETDGRVGTDGRLYLHTNLDAPRFRIAVADPARPEPAAWRDLVPESDDVLAGYALTDDALVVASSRHAVGRVAVHDRETGAFRAEVDLPGPGSVLGVSARPEGGDEVHLGYTDFTTPPRVYRYRVAQGRLELWMDAPGQVDLLAGVTARQETYRSKDGTEVRLFLLHRDGLTPDGARPTILYGYGGFNISMTPAWSAVTAAWVEQGGVYAIANLRGGSEEGEAWHRAGMRDRKQNVFDDFAAAAEHLIATGWTSPRRLAISGGSNGGLLVGAALTQRPELFAAVACSAPLLDMVRYERFGLGETWNDEYGRADDPTELGWLVAYSPYHHVVKGTQYPAVLFTVFDSDTRVDPLHARKMCAALQWATASERPVLLRRERQTGHGARSVRRTVELQADVLAFLAAEVDLELA